MTTDHKSIPLHSTRRSTSPRPPPVKRIGPTSTIFPFSGAKRFRRLLLALKRTRPTARHSQSFSLLLFCIAILFVYRQLSSSNQYITDNPPAKQPYQPLVRRPVPSILQWPHPENNYPPELSPPDPSLYGTGGERCFSVGQPIPNSGKPPDGHPARFWKMNSRALCYLSKPACIYGRTMRNLLTFEKRGSGSCHVVSVTNSTLTRASSVGLNESCAAFRTHFIAEMFGREVFREFNTWYAHATARQRPTSRHMPVMWNSDFAIIIPKYAWSYNICHYNRIWNFVIYVLRNLRLFIPGDISHIKRVDILFRAGYSYEEHWHRGIREATIPVLEKELGIRIGVGRLRHNFNVEFQCIRQGILLGEEGRVDAFPFFNDTPVWNLEQNDDDSHWPTIPHDSLWLRDTVLKYGNFPLLSNSTDGPAEVYTSIPVPPRKIAVLQRSPRSRRRLTMGGRRWLDATLRDLAERYNMKLEYVRTSRAMTFPQQIDKIRDVGVAVGLHGANIVNTVFMPPGGSLFEIFPWRYVRFYYVSGANSGLRYSFHEPEGGIERDCHRNTTTCFMKYRESLIFLTDRDRQVIQLKLEKAISHVARLHDRYPDGRIPLKKAGSTYHFSA